MLGWLLGLLWLLCLKAWLASHLLVDADTLVVADLWQALSKGGSLGDWIMCPHPYVFPDLLLYGVAALLAKGVAARQAAFGLVEGFFLWWTLARLMKRLLDLDGSTARAFAGAGLLLLLLFLDPGSGLGQIFSPGYHGGALLCAMAWLAWALGQDRRPSSWPGTVWAALGLGLAWASDQLVPAWVLAPGLLLSAALTGRARRKIWAAAGLACVFRELTLWFWHGEGMRIATYRLSFFWDHAFGLLGSLASELAPAAQLSLGPLLLALLALGLLWGLAREVPAAGWLAAAACLLLASWLALGALEGHASGRYGAGFVWLSAPWVPLLLSRRFGGGPQPLLACGLLGVLWLGWLSPPPQDPPEMAQARWLDAQAQALGMDHGMADYAHARPLRLLGDRDLGLVPVITDKLGLAPYAWSVDRKAFDVPVRPQFVVINGLDPRAILARLGPPSGKAGGPGIELWLYPRPGPAVPGI